MSNKVVTLTVRHLQTTNAKNGKKKWHTLKIAAEQTKISPIPKGF